jgi:cytochrome c
VQLGYSRRLSMKTLQALLIGITLTVAAIGCAHESTGAGAATAGAGVASGGGGDALAQADRGGALYGQHCASCHGNAGQGSDKAPPVVGQNALPLDPPAAAKYRKGQFHTAREVFDFVKVNMPPNADKLPEAQVLDVVAFDLKANGVDLTGKTLTPESLAAIVLHP